MNKARFAAFVTPVGVTSCAFKPQCFGIPKVTLDLELQPIIVHEWRIREIEVTAEQDDMGAGLGAQVGLRDDDDIQRLGKSFVEQLHLIHWGLDALTVVSLQYCSGRLS